MVNYYSKYLEREDAISQDTYQKAIRQRSVEIISLMYDVSIKNAIDSALLIGVEYTCAPPCSPNYCEVRDK